MSRVPVLNAGSSSIKFAVFEGEMPLGQGQVEGIGGIPRLRARSATGEVLLDRSWDAAAAPQTHAAALGALIFTAGIGENARRLRGQICEGLGFLGATLDAARNATNSAEISPPGAPVRVLMRRTGEEAMIARHTRAVLAQAGATG